MYGNVDINHNMMKETEWVVKVSVKTEVTMVVTQKLMPLSTSR